MKEMVFQWLKDWLWSMIRKCLPLLVMASVTTTLAHGQGASTAASLWLKTPTASEIIGRTGQVATDDNWSEFEVKSIGFRLPRHWQSLRMEEADLGTEFEEIVKMNPKLREMNVDTQVLRDLDGFFINTRDSTESAMENMSIKFFDRPPFDRTTLDQALKMIAGQFTSQGLDNKHELIQVNGKDVGRIQFRMEVQNLAGKSLQVEVAQFLFLNSKAILLVNFAYDAKHRSQRAPDIEAILETIEWL